MNSDFNNQNNELISPENLANNVSNIDSNSNIESLDILEPEVKTNVEILNQPEPINNDVLNEIPQGIQEPVINSAQPIENLVEPSVETTTGLNTNAPVDNQTINQTIETETPIVNDINITSGQLISAENDNVTTKPTKKKFSFSFSFDSLLFVIMGLINYFVIAPLILKALYKKIAEALVYASLLSKFGVDVHPTVSTYIYCSLWMFVIIGSFTILLSCILNVFFGGNLFKKGSKMIYICLVGSLIAGVILTVLMINFGVTDIVAIIERVCTLDGKQLFLF